jgi:hypothetical protein
MKYIVDAWLERPDPQIRILDPRSGAIRLAWQPERVRELLDSGRISAADFDCQDECCVCELVRDLFLLSCIVEGSVCVRRRSTKPS